VNLLIGSKKFTEGWSSWRVSTMGLMNVGKGEGAQIIQLFGRGVRLKGYDLSLKRSGKTQLPEGVDRPKHIAVLETLGIFGIHADYMAQFRDFLEEEGLPTNDDRIEFLLPVIKNLGTQKLKTDPAQEDDQRRQHRVRRCVSQARTGADTWPAGPGQRSEHEYLQKNQVVLNWYPKIQAMKSAASSAATRMPRQTRRTWCRACRFLDLDRAVLRAGALQGRARLVQPEPDAARDRAPARRSELVPAADSAGRAGVRFVRASPPVGGDRRWRCSRSTPSATTRSASASGSCRTWSTATWKRRPELPGRARSRRTRATTASCSTGRRKEIVAKLES
jgi:hypothetical protein